MASVPAFAQSGEVTPPAVRTAQQGNVPVTKDFSIGPTRFEVKVAPGRARTLEVELTNQEGEQATFALYTEDFAGGQTARESTRLYGALDGPFPAKGWVTPMVSRITLKHGERAYIPITVTVPLDAEPGDHYAALVVQRDQTEEEKKAPGFQIIARVASLMLITVPGTVVEKGSLTSLRATAPVYFSYPVQLVLEGKNEGTVHFSPSGTIRIRNILGLVVDELPVQGWIILRHAVNTVTFDWKPRFALGRYTAAAEVTVLGQTQTLTTSFWVIPALPVLLALLAIFLVSFLVQYFFSRFEIKKK